MPTPLADTAARLESLLRLRSIPFAMKLFESPCRDGGDTQDPAADSVHTLDQVVAQAARLGWTVGITAEDLVGAQCRAVVGLGNAKDEAWRSGGHMARRVVCNARKTPPRTRRRCTALTDGKYAGAGGGAAGVGPARPA